MEDFTTRYDTGVMGACYGGLLGVLHSLGGRFSGHV
jgi:hypothetical protein